MGTVLLESGIVCAQYGTARLGTRLGIVHSMGIVLLGLALYARTVLLGLDIVRALYG